MIECLTYEHEAMATRWRISISGRDDVYARQAAEAAFDEIDRLENELSRFKDTTDIAELNSLPAHTPAIIGLDAFQCLKLAEQLTAMTSGVFDVTIGRLFACWMTKGGNPRQPTDDELQEARKLSGFHLVQMDEDALTVAVSEEGVQIDLGGVGKGYALDCAASLLEEWGIHHALLDSGRSTVRALDGPTEGEGWPVGLGPGRKISLKNLSMAASGFDVKGAHIINPLDGQPVNHYQRTWAFADNSAIADGLSTAFMMMSKEDVAACCESVSGAGAVLLPRDAEKPLFIGSIKEEDVSSYS